MKSKPFFSILFAVAGIIIAGWISYLSFKESKRNNQINAEIDSLKAEAENLRQNNQEMTDKISYFETPEFQEKMAKEKLNLQKEGESVAVIKPNPSLRNDQTGEDNNIGKVSGSVESPAYKKWWNYFFN